ncbi:unnamed protein product [Lymnaea stagnalis]|uniref:Uncharacterized protein n=1 Tax=Lymnaea stagnalis TaxID=6523 RepID=A0AAV2HUL5_LYMST
MSTLVGNIPFPLIEQYRTMVKDLELEEEESKCVTRQLQAKGRYFMDYHGIDIKEEPLVYASQDNNMAANPISSYPDVVTDEMPNFLRPLPRTVPSQAPAYQVASVPISNQTKTSTYITELGGSGCTLVTSGDFLTDSSSSSNSSCTPPSVDDSLDYLDLDQQTLSLYDFEPMDAKQCESADTSERLEEAVMLMRDVIHKDCAELDIPYDPLAWNPEHVRKWITWVCQKNKVHDVSVNLYPIDGPTLCSLDPNYFSQNLGEIGRMISSELELSKAANRCFPNPPKGAYITVDYERHQQWLDSTTLAPCLSPALSTSSSSLDSSTPGPHSEDDTSYSKYNYRPDKNSQFSTKMSNNDENFNRILAKHPTGRGHKQTIHLWQFLKELLLSKENHHDCIRWLDRKAGIFKIEDSKKVALLWGTRKNRPAMNYDKLSRSVRQYYKKGIIKKTEQSKRLVYQFCAGYL